MCAKLVYGKSKARTQRCGRYYSFVRCASPHIRVRTCEHRCFLIQVFPGSVGLFRFGRGLNVSAKPDRGDRGRRADYCRLNLKFSFASSLVPEIPESQHSIGNLSCVNNAGHPFLRFLLCFEQVTKRSSDICPTRASPEIGGRFDCSPHRTPFGTSYSRPLVAAPSLVSSLAVLDLFFSRPLAHVVADHCGSIALLTRKFPQRAYKLHTDVLYPSEMSVGEAHKGRRSLVGCRQGNAVRLLHDSRRSYRSHC